MAKLDKLQAWELYMKACAKVDKIIHSDCLIYKLAGGETERIKDILNAQAVSMRCFEYFSNVSGLKPELK